MIRLFLGPLLLSFLPFTVFAEPAFVQSGEHANFTRLVTKVPSGNSWRLEQIEGMATLHIENYQSGFDTSRIFDFIPKSRVARVEANQSQLSIFLGCDCEVTAFDVQGGHVAIDVTSSDPKPSEVSPHVAKTRPPKLPNPLQQDIDKATSSTSGMATFIHEPRASLKLKEINILSDVQANLIRELGSATTRGVLEPARTRTLVRSPYIDAEIFKSTSNPQESTPVINAAPKTGNIRISTSMDAPTRISSPQNAILGIGNICPEDDILDITNWGDDRPFDVQISEARLSLYDELDNLNLAAALSLARLYLYFGFGAEARQILTLDPTLPNTHPILLDIAEIIEGGHVKKPNSLVPLIDCESDVSLWATLSDKNLNDTLNNPTFALLALSKLPTHLRKILAPMLSDFFLARGDSASARTALRSLERSPETLTSAAKMAQANIHIDEGNTNKGAEQLENVVDDGTTYSPSALVALIDTKLQSGEAIKNETVELIEAYASELKDTSLGPDLRRAYVLSLISTNQFDRAMSQIKSITDEINDASLIEVQTHLLQHLGEQASDIVFVDIALQQSAEDLVQVEPNIRIAIASRLLKLGFAKHAQDIIHSILEKPANESRQTLAAQIALALDQPFQAQAELLGLTSETAQTIRADAKHMVGEHVDAYALYRGANQSEKANESAWLAESWRELITPDTPIFGPVAALRNPEDISSGGSTGMLERTKSALAESAAARQALSNLMATSNLTP